jgi:hypothetical protein
MSSNIDRESTGGVDKIAISESARQQISAQASEGKVPSADTKLRGSSFLESFTEFPEFPDVA